MLPTYAFVDLIKSIELDFKYEKCSDLFNIREPPKPIKASQAWQSQSLL